MSDPNPNPAPPFKSPASVLAEAMTQLAENLAPILEVATGYKQKCLEAGFDETVSNMMAAEYHNQMLIFVVSKLHR